MSELGSGRFEVKCGRRGTKATIVLESTGYAGVFSERVTLTLDAAVRAWYSRSA
jgi:hypothetical protein